MKSQFFLGHSHYSHNNMKWTDAGYKPTSKAQKMVEIASKLAAKSVTAGSVATLDKDI